MRVLEVGCGQMPASMPRIGGEIFDDPSVHYVGIDLPVKLGHDGTVTADAALMPFRDESFDLALMKNVFGQFPVEGAPLLPTHMTRLSSEDPFFKLRMSLYGLAEVFRVLKPQGELVILEENTPLPVSEVTNALAHVGLQTDQVTRDTDESYLPLRAKYYDNTNHYSMAWHEEPYILRASKPTSEFQPLWQPNRWVTLEKIQERLNAVFGEERQLSTDRHVIAVGAERYKTR